MSELVTGEAVALELRPAKLPSRALAVLLDLVVAFVGYIVVTMALVASTASLDEAAQVAISIASFLLLLVGGPIAVETLSHGRSLGKLALGLRVVRDDGGPIRFRHALVRGAVGVVEILMTLGVIACIASLVSARGRRLGDVFAGTLVVRERVPAGRGSFVPPPPPWLAGQFSALDLSAVPEGLWLAIRQYLTRMGQLDPQVGQALAERLASDLAARTGSPAPHGVPAAPYLAAVLQERQAREAQRAFGSGTPGGAGQFGHVPGSSAEASSWGGPVSGGPVGVQDGNGAVMPPPSASPYQPPTGVPSTGGAPAAAGPAAGGSYPDPIGAGPYSAPVADRFAPPLPTGSRPAPPQSSPAQLSPPQPSLAPSPAEQSAQPAPPQDKAPEQAGRPGTGFVPPA